MECAVALEHGPQRGNVLGHVVLLVFCHLLRVRLKKPRIEGIESVAFARLRFDRLLLCAKYMTERLHGLGDFTQLGR